METLPLCTLSLSQGKKKDTIDIFGRWQPNHDLSQREAADVTLPMVLCRHDDVLFSNMVLEEDNRIPFRVFDALRMLHGIDVTALSVSQTRYGNLYRSHVLMSAPS